MSDTKLRELERRWKETGAVDDEAAYLLERVRVGDLTQERLELAAYCGHEGARRATGVVDGLAVTRPWLVEAWSPARYTLHPRGAEWVRRLTGWGRDVTVGFAEAVRTASDSWLLRAGTDLAHGGTRLHAEIAQLLDQVRTGSGARPMPPAQNWPPYTYLEELHLVLAARELVDALAQEGEHEFFEHLTNSCAHLVDFHGELLPDFPQLVDDELEPPDPDPMHWPWWAERIDSCLVEVARLVCSTLVKFSLNTSRST